MATTDLITCLRYPNIFILFFTTLVPIWIYLEFILNEDPHPEPRYLIIFSILLGFLATIISYYGEYWTYLALGSSDSYLYFFLSAFIEEFLKFFLIFLFIFPTKYFDEPVDAMIYMGFSAIGFSFLETFAYLCKSFLELNYQFVVSIFLVIIISILRFLGANFLHLLASLIIGFGYGISIKIRRILPFIVAFISSTLLHFIYNIFIIKDDIRIYIFPILWAVFLLVLIQFKILKIKDDRVGT